MRIRYDDTNLQRLLNGLRPKERRKAFKTAFRKVGNEVRRTAVSNLKSSGLGNAGKMAGSVRTVVFRREAGFTVTVRSRKASRKTGKGERGMHVNRRGLKKPVLVWAETGTASRTASRGQRFHGPEGWRTAGKDRGRMRPYSFLVRTRRQTRDRVPGRLQEEIREVVNKIAKENGCN